MYRYIQFQSYVNQCFKKKKKINVKVLILVISRQKELIYFGKIDVIYKYNIKYKYDKMKDLICKKIYLKF